MAGKKEATEEMAAARLDELQVSQLGLQAS